VYCNDVLGQMIVVPECLLTSSEFATKWVRLEVVGEMTLEACGVAHFHVAEGTFVRILRVSSLSNFPCSPVHMRSLMMDKIAVALHHLLACFALEGTFRTFRSVRTNLFLRRIVTVEMISEGFQGFQL
jgi:hypothetical protein